MNFEQKIESFLYLGEKKISIAFFKGKENLIFNKNLIIDNNGININENIDLFLEKIILEFEKKNNFFIKNMNVILDHNQFSKIDISIKDKIHNKIVTKKDIEYLIFSLKKIIQENNKEIIISRIRINSFKLNEKVFCNFHDLPAGDTLCLDVMFEGIKKDTHNKIKSHLSKLEIDINRCFSLNSLKLEKLRNNENECVIAAGFYYDYDESEVLLTSKSKEKISFFERFFNFFN